MSTIWIANLTDRDVAMYREAQGHSRCEYCQTSIAEGRSPLAEWKHATDGTQSALICPDCVADKAYEYDSEAVNTPQPIEYVVVFEPAEDDGRANDEMGLQFNECGCHQEPQRIAFAKDAGDVERIAAMLGDRVIAKGTLVELLDNWNGDDYEWTCICEAACGIKK